MPFTKAFKDAEAHFAEALGLTKPDPKSAALEKTGTAAQTTGESPKEATGKSVQEEGKATEAGAATGTKEALDRKGICRRQGVRQRQSHRRRRKDQGRRQGHDGEQGTVSPRRPRPPRNPPKTQSRTPPCQELRLMPTRLPGI